MASKIVLLTIGSDPEMFLFKSGVPVSSIGLIPGSKDQPFKIGEYEYVQVDNVAIEFNVKPSETPEEFIESLNVCYSWAKKHLSAIDPSIEIVPVASTVFDDKELRPRAARMFGCDPDFNAWNEGYPNSRPNGPKNLRSCGGHIHLGISKIGDFDLMRLVRLLDQEVGMYTAEICGDERRRLLYGSAGSFRYKSYGLEYRTPSVSWIKSEESIREVFSRCEKAVDLYNEGADANQSVRDFINNKKAELV